MAAIRFNHTYFIIKIILLYLGLCQGFNDSTENKNLPVLYEFDNYQDCITRNASEENYPAKYCVVLVEIQPEANSLLWQQISNMSSNRFNYRHDRIFRGVCTEKCKHLTKNLTHNNNAENGLLTSEETEELKRYHNTSLERRMRNEYQNEIFECLNQEYMENYNLSTKTFIDFCVDPQQKMEKDIYFYLTLLLIFVIIILNVASSVYDANLKSQQLKPNGNYYETKHNDKINRYLTSFSLYRNYKRLVTANTSDIGIDLAFLDGFRSILCLLIVLEHAFLLLLVPAENTDYVENLFALLFIKLFLHALVWLELFFVLSGLLLFVKFEKGQYVTPESSLYDCARVFLRLLFSRYLRYLPSLLFVIIFHANISYYNEYGLFKGFFGKPNCLPCRTEWWQNLLMINNFFMKNSCLMHTWYIAADFQLYGLFLLVLIIMAKYPAMKITILTGMGILAAIINFGVNYILKLESVFTLRVETFRYSYFQNIDTAKHMYFSTYTNINSFLLGIICGFIYMNYLRNKPENKTKLGNILKNSPYIGWLCILGILYLGTTMIMNTETTIWSAAYGLLHRHVGLSIVAIIVVLRGMCNGGGLLKSPVFRLLSRISFQVYLWQIVILFNVFIMLNKSQHLSFLTIHFGGYALYVVTSVIAFVVALTVEYPIAEIISTIDIEKTIKISKRS